MRLIHAIKDLNLLAGVKQISFTPAAALSLFCLFGLSLSLAWEDIHAQRLEDGWQESLFLLSLYCALQIREGSVIALNFLLNFSFICLLTASICYLEKRLKKRIIGGADLSFILCLSPILRPFAIVYILPLALVLALPQALFLLILRRFDSTIALIPYLTFAAILLL